jgi:hypothetical protein
MSNVKKLKIAKIERKFEFLNSKDSKKLKQAK